MRIRLSDPAFRLPPHRSFAAAAPLSLPIQTCTCLLVIVVVVLAFCHGTCTPVAIAVFALLQTARGISCANHSRTDLSPTTASCAGSTQG